MDSQYPLKGRRVLVTRPVHQADDFMAALATLGAVPILFPTIEILPAVETAPLDEAIRRLAGPAPAYDWLVVTSVNGVTAFWERLEAAGLDETSLAAVKVAAIGPATAEALRERQVEPALTPEVYTAEGILEAFDRLGSIAGQWFLLARADIARKALAEGLARRGAIVEEIAAYRTAPVAGGSLPPAADIVTFTSSSTVQGYVNCLAGQAPAATLKDSLVVCIGPITAATAEALGVPVHAVAEIYTIEGILQTLKALESRSGV
jgi:uroporphyrinogen III methyltransferase/synthase